MKKEIDKISKELGKIDNIDIMILGDFNGHVGFLGKQDKNNNGELILKIINEQDLLMMNIDAKCTGEITWEQGSSKSVIDYVLVSHSMYDKIEIMRIDDKWEILKLSDHNLINIKIRTQREINKFVKNEEEYMICRISDSSKEKFNKYVKELLVDTTSDSDAEFNMEKFDGIIKKAYKATLEVKIKKRKKQNNKNEPIWCNKTIKKEISRKRDMNKILRKSKCSEESEIIWKNHHDQRVVIQKLVKDAVQEHERKKTETILRDKNRGKRIW